MESDIARSLFGVATIPGDGQTRSLLDPVEPSYLRAPLWEVSELLQARGRLEAHEGAGGKIAGGQWANPATGSENRASAARLWGGQGKLTFAPLRV